MEIELDYENIIETFLNNIKDHTVEYKTHPTATMINESFIIYSGGDCMGFKKSCFIKRNRKNGDIFRISNKTVNYWNWNLFLK
jgi:hypothetical protein